jgi:methionine sulfoxide reductase heme-binding subunit
MKNQETDSVVGKSRLRSGLNWRSVDLNLFGLAVMAFVLTQGSTAWDAATFDPGLESGKWAIRWLIACLTMSPLSVFLGWRSAGRLSKPAGLWAFAFAAVHLFFNIREDQLNWLTFSMQPFIALGLLGMLILTALAVTSNRSAMQRLQKNWKRLHRLVYVASLAVSMHAILATTASKKLALRDPQSIGELQMYLAVMIVLLAARLPVIRRISRQGFVPRQFSRRADVAITTINVPSLQPRLVTEIYVAEDTIPQVEIFRKLGEANALDEQKELFWPAGLPLAR